jgi:hypothetical protein
MAYLDTIMGLGYVHAHMLAHISLVLIVPTSILQPTASQEVHAGALA